MTAHKYIILLLTLTACINSKTNAAIDSLPPCFNSMAITGKPATLTEYEYKGRRLFSFRTTAQLAPSNNSDPMTVIRIYDYYDCTLVCTWTKGGIAGLNRIIPDSIEKGKIKTTRFVSLDTTTGTKTKPTPVSLSDTIQQLAIIKKSRWIEESNYDGRPVYRFQSPTQKPDAVQIFFSGPYFDEKATIVVPKKMTGNTTWWYDSNKKFIRTQFRPGFR